MFEVVRSAWRHQPGGFYGSKYPQPVLPRRTRAIARGFALFSLVSCLVLALFTAKAAPFEEEIRFTQPDGATMVVRGKGDEFHAVFETLEGYTVLFDQARQAYVYARLAADGSLASTGVLAHKPLPPGLQLRHHLRISDEVRRESVAARRRKWEDGTGNAAEWKAHKAMLRQYGESLSATNISGSGPQFSPPTSYVKGAKVGLTLLIDFSDDPATIPHAEVVDFCNADGYTGYGNKGSVKEYFLENSNGLMTYTNVVTVYIRAPRPKSYYNDTTQESGTMGNILIRDALNTLKALPNYTSQILPAMSSLTYDSRARVVACNVFFTGASSGVWSMGLWPHAWTLVDVGAQALGNGMSIYKYQITHMGSSLSLGTFCHENGHMLLGYPDLYDYDYDSAGGAGQFCLMNSGGNGTNPKQICAYLKRASGWATTVELNSMSQLLGTVTATNGAGFNVFYRYQKPGVPTEYFLIENRQKIRHDAGLPGEGVAIWHIDELGDHSNQSTSYNSSHQNYEVSLVQADGRYDLQRDVNTGDATDLFYAGNPAAGYRNEFSVASTPAARWWDGLSSGLTLSDFSVSGPFMTFRVGTLPPPSNVYLPPVLKMTIANGTASLTWPPGLSHRLQMSRGTLNAWQDVPDVTTNSVALPLDSSVRGVYFRLKQ